MKHLTPFKLPICMMFLFVLLALAGCGPNPEQIAAQTATAQTAVAALWTSTPTSTATPTATTAPSSTPTATVTPSITPSRTPTQSPTAAPSAGSGERFTIQDVTFSLVVPEGWEQVPDPKRVILNGPTVDGTKLILSFSLDQYSIFGSPMEADEVGILMFSAHVQDTLKEMTKNVVQLSEDFPDLAEGRSYFRWVMEHSPNGQELHQAFYIFGHGRSFLTVMYGRPKSSGDEYDAMIDEAMKTLIFEP